MTILLRERQGGQSLALAVFLDFAFQQTCSYKKRPTTKSEKKKSDGADSTRSKIKFNKLHPKKFKRTKFVETYK
jgi:hypothetical protein